MLHRDGSRGVGDADASWGLCWAQGRFDLAAASGWVVVAQEGPSEPLANAGRTLSLLGATTLSEGSLPASFPECTIAGSGSITLAISTIHSNTNEKGPPNGGRA